MTKLPICFDVLAGKLSDLSKRKASMVSGGGLSFIAVADYFTDQNYPLLIFYLVPITIATWSIGKQAGFLFSIISIFPSILDMQREDFWIRNPMSALWNGSLFFGLFIVFVTLLDSLKKELRTKREAMQIIESDRQRALFISQHDNLTALPNRVTFHSKLKSLIDYSKTTKNSFHVFFIDIDQFKQINDTFGHYAGDLFLKGIAKTLQGCVDPVQDILARLSGDEFGIICRSTPNKKEFAQRLLAAVRQPIMVDGRQIQANISIGAATFPVDAPDPAHLLICADLAMYQAKKMGRAMYQAYTEDLATSARRRREIRDQIKCALEANELKLHYQPLFDNDCNKVCGVEALLRWEQENIPYLTTTEIIAIAEESELISQIGRWTLKVACNQAKIWKQAHRLYLPVAVNISSRHFNEAGFVDFVKNVLDEAALDPSCLKLEITERVVMENNEGNRNTMKALRDLGVHISIDDFGIGYSSLSYLKNFAFRSLKIDQFFVKGLPHDTQDAAITNAIVSLARGLGATVIAEGVENEEQLNYLYNIGCDQYQGYLFSEPIDAERLASKIETADWDLPRLVSTHRNHCAAVNY